MINSDTRIIRPKGRPTLTVEQIDEMRSKIAGAAQRLFREEGYAAISMRRLAKEVGCTPMTLYKYYDGKIDILRHLWSQIFKDVFVLLQQKADAAALPDDKLTALSQAYVSYWLNHTEHYRMVFMSEGVTQPDVSIFIADEQIIALFSYLFQQVANSTGSSSSDQYLKQKADFLICSLNGIAHSMITMSGYSWSDPDLLVEMTIAVILRP